MSSEDRPEDMIDRGGAERRHSTTSRITAWSLAEHPQEIIDWGSTDHRDSIRSAESKYGFISESLRQSFPEAKTCLMFCGGKKCKYCDPESSPVWNNDQKVIKGLFSTWVTENILATSRPSSKLIEKYKIIEQFHECGIRSIINLQRPGEHATCGPDELKNGGFSYCPEEFMNADVFFYNFAWQDFNVGSLTNILDMVKVMQFALSEGKVAVHCHAGLGRTGVLISCYLVFANRISGNEAIHYVRLKRPGSVQTRGQVECIKQFAEWLQPFRVIYASVADGVHSFSLPQYLERQKHFLHGFEARRLRDIPKIAFVCCSRLVTLAGKDVSLLETHDLMKELITLPGLSQPKLSSAHSSPILTKKDSSPSHSNQFLCKTFDSVTPLHRDHQMRISYSQNRLSDFGSTTSSGENIQQIEGVTGEGGGGSGGEEIDKEAEMVAQAMAQTEYTKDVLGKVRDYKITLNEENGSWTKLTKESDPLVLSALLWDWIDHLREPILHAQDLPQMLQFIEEPRTGLGQLDKGARATVVHLVATVALLRPISESTHTCVLQRLISTLTHQNMRVDSHNMLSPDVKLTSSTTSVMRDNVANRLMAFFQRLILWFCRIAVVRDKKKSKCCGGEVGDRARDNKEKGKRKGGKVVAKREGEGGKGREGDGGRRRRISEETGETVTSDGGDES